MHVQLSQPAKSTCLKLFQTLGESTETCQAIPLLLSHKSVSAFGLCGCPSPCLEGRDPYLAKAGERRGCLCIPWVMANTQHLPAVPGVTRLWGHHWSEMLYMVKLQLFCVSVLGWKFLCNTDDNILSFPYPKR